ncbi:hypothetical protein AOG23_23475 [Rhizobium acidisoli]|nr:hypothetical protein AOG23_23475 [Rhizobium acidisoli]
MPTEVRPPAGTMNLNVLNAVAQFERGLLIERTQSGLKRAKSEKKALGRAKRRVPAPGVHPVPNSVPTPPMLRRTGALAGTKCQKACW